MSSQDGRAETEHLAQQVDQLRKENAVLKLSLLKVARDLANVASLYHQAIAGQDGHP